MPPQNRNEGIRRRDGMRQRFNNALTVGMFFIGNLQSTPHQGRHQESNNSTGAIPTRSFHQENQRVKKIHGGQKFPPTQIIKHDRQKQPVKKDRGYLKRQSGYRLDSRSNYYLSPNSYKDNSPTDSENNERRVTGGGRGLKLLAIIDPGLAQIYQEVLTKNKTRPNEDFNTGTIINEIREAYKVSIIQLIGKTNIADLEKVASGDFEGIENSKLKSLIVTLKTGPEQFIAEQLLAEQMTASLLQQNFNFSDELKNEIGDLYGKLKEFLPIGLTLTALMAFTTVALPQIQKRVNLKEFEGLSFEQKKKLVNTLLISAFILSACGAAIATSTPAPTVTPDSPIIIPAATQTHSPAVENATSIAPIDQNLPSPFFNNLYLGKINGNPWGEISASNINAQNTNFILPDSQLASQHVFYYSLEQSQSGQQESLRGFGLRQEYLIDVFNADFDKASGNILTGTLPDGTKVTFNNGFWQYDKDGKKYYLLSNVANLENEYIGYPVLVTDASTQRNLYLGLVSDESGVLLDNQSFEPAFKPIAEVAKNIGFTGNPDLVGSLSYDANGNIVVSDQSGNILETVLYLNPYAPVSPALTPTVSPEQMLSEMNLPDLGPNIEFKLENGVAVAYYHPDPTKFSAQTGGIQLGHFENGGLVMNESVALTVNDQVLQEIMDNKLNDGNQAWQVHENIKRHDVNVSRFSNIIGVKILTNPSNNLSTFQFTMLNNENGHNELIQLEPPEISHERWISSGGSTSLEGKPDLFINGQLTSQQVLELVQSVQANLQNPSAGASYQSYSFTSGLARWIDTQVSEQNTTIENVCSWLGVPYVYNSPTVVGFCLDQYSNPDHRMSSDAVKQKFMSNIFVEDGQLNAERLANLNLPPLKADQGFWYFVSFQTLQ